MDRKVAIGLVGTGRWGTNHLRVLPSVCAFQGVAEINPEKRRGLQLKGIAAFEDWRALARSCEALIIATPTQTHYEIAKQALEAGLHVFVEKPLSCDLREIRELVALATCLKRILWVGYIYRFHPSVQELQRRVGDISRIGYVFMRYTSKGRPWSMGGAIWNFGIHQFDTLNCIFAKPLGIRADVQFLSDRIREDSAFVTIRYEGFNAYLEMSRYHPEKKRDIWIVGGGEQYHTNLLENNLQRWYEIESSEGSEIHERIECQGGEPLFQELCEFAECVDHWPRIENKGAESALTVHMCEAALQSAERGGIWVDLQLQSKENI